MNGEEQPKRSIDERLDALTQNVELMAAMHKHNMEQLEQHQEQLEQHEQEWRRFRRALRAGLEAYLNGGDA
jgi:hypothetical protein